MKTVLILEDNAGLPDNLMAVLQDDLPLICRNKSMTICAECYRTVSLVIYDQTSGQVPKRHY